MSKSSYVGQGKKLKVTNEVGRKKEQALQEIYHMLTRIGQH